MGEVERETMKKLTETVGSVRVEKTILHSPTYDSTFYKIAKDGYQEQVELSEAEAVEANAMLYRLIEAS